MDVLHIVRTFGDKTQPYTTNLLRKLNSNRVDNHLVACDLNLLGRSDFVVDISAKSRLNYFSIDLLYALFVLYFDKRLKKLKFNSSIDKIKFLSKWNKIINRRFHLVHLHHLQVVDINLLKYFEISDIPVLVSFRGKDIIVNPLLAKEKERLKREMNYISHIHVISNYLKKEVLKHNFGLPIDVVYRGGSKQTNVLKERPIIKDQNKPIKVIVVGRLAWEKGQFYVLDALYRLKLQGYIIQLDIFGDGYLEEFLVYRINQLGLSEEVRLKGYIDNPKLKKIMIDYDFAIQPSIYEALSNGILDFISCNIPCAVTEESGMSELIKDGVNGLSFDIRNPLSIDKTIIEMINYDFKDMKEFNKKLLEKFSFENEIKGLERIYKSLI